LFNDTLALQAVVPARCRYGRHTRDVLFCTVTGSTKSANLHRISTHAEHNSSRNAQDNEVIDVAILTIFRRWHFAISSRCTRSKSDLVYRAIESGVTFVPGRLCRLIPNVIAPANLENVKAGAYGTDQMVRVVVVAEFNGLGGARSLARACGAATCADTSSGVLSARSLPMK
jgi:hypothetical protein